VDLDAIASEKTFPEPRMVIVGQGERRQGIYCCRETNPTGGGGFNILEGLITLLSCYYVFYVSYPKSGPAAGTFLFLQEVVLNEPA